MHAGEEEGGRTTMNLGSNRSISDCFDSEDIIDFEELDALLIIADLPHEKLECLGQCLKVLPCSMVFIRFNSSGPSGVLVLQKGYRGRFGRGLLGRVWSCP